MCVVRRKLLPRKPVSMDGFFLRLCLRGSVALHFVGLGAARDCCAQAGRKRWASGRVGAHLACCLSRANVAIVTLSKINHHGSHLRPSPTQFDNNVNATYAGPKPDDRYVLKTTAGSGSQAQGPAGCPRREIPPDGKSLPTNCLRPLEFSLDGVCHETYDGGPPRPAPKTRTRIEMSLAITAFCAPLSATPAPF